ncbi:glycerol-3-phosphate mitochondrial protein [Colletotrichum karsti]|uniref:Glycerol-3-phosphate dehydrogenase n=1 Tax=Colletotrichum karsti TaxID=1095194 RepID=A0A9P6LF75_9PEZI|nr:glycerol-3-phosphate mitochondrial protein [Colletotrichum karsti]KAF9871198.1 glycerol-3-phosphate mitochondrial protein [Colletotrichum karsti]
MASRFSRLAKPLAAAAVVTTGGAAAFLTFNSGRGAHTFDKPLVELKRDNEGRIVPPTFPSVKDRAAQLADLRASASEEYDLLVIGGGATGTGIALDAVTRGLKVALVERDDWSAGTSSKSTKLVHGGVRYLEKAILNLDYAQWQLVKEALHERKTFLTVAPHLSSSLPIVLPIQQWYWAPYAWVGTKMYDLLAGSQGLESSYFMSKSKALEAFPLLRREGLFGALAYYDGQHNDSRMNVSLALTAALYGATVANHVEVTSLEKNPQGKICGAKVRDVLNPGSESFSVRAKGVINATGPFADAIERMDNPNHKSIVAPASGAHIMLPGNICPNGIGLLQTSSDGRVIFVLPWQGSTLAGTTDTACAVEKEPVAQEQDIAFILSEVNKMITPESALSRSDVMAAWSGIRPLVKDPKAKNTESLVRSHLVTVSDSGLLTCAGGKWTTYRQMAQDAVDEAISAFDLKPRAGLALPDISGAGLPSGITTTGHCITTNVPLVGAHGFSTQLPGHLISHFSLDPDVAHHLATNYGDRAFAVAAVSTARILPGFPFVEGEIRHGVRAEQAQTATDLISRRTRLAFLDAESALRALPRVIDVMAEELAWSESRKNQEWTETVRFLHSMGLPQGRLGVTRDEVLSSTNSSGGAKAIAAAPKPQAAASSGGIKVGLGEIQAGGALARDQA